MCVSSQTLDPVRHIAGVLASSPLAAQWIRYPSAGAPRTADGTVDISAATPRAADGKLDFFGIWTNDEVDPRRGSKPVVDGLLLGKMGWRHPGRRYERLIAELIDEICLENERSLTHMK